jgi:hypothetical protein
LAALGTCGRRATGCVEPCPDFHAIRPAEKFFGGARQGR